MEFTVQHEPDNDGICVQAYHTSLKVYLYLNGNGLSMISRMTIVNALKNLRHRRSIEVFWMEFTHVYGPGIDDISIHSHETPWKSCDYLIGSVTLIKCIRMMIYAQKNMRWCRNIDVVWTESGFGNEHEIEGTCTKGIDGPFLWFWYLKGAQYEYLNMKTMV